MPDFTNNNTTAQSATDEQSKLLRSLDRQAAIGRELRALSDQQRQYLNEEQSDAVLAVITDRQSLVDELSALDHDCLTWFNDWPGTLAALSDENRRRAQDLRQSLEKDIAKVLAADDEDRASIESQRRVIDGQLRNLARGRTTNRAYGDAHNQPTTITDNRYTDRQG